MNSNDTAASEVPVSQLSYEAAVAELEQIVRDLDAGSVNVDVLSERFQRAIDLVEELDGRILRTRQKVDSLLPRLDALGSGRSSNETGSDG